MVRLASGGRKLSVIKSNIFQVLGNFPDRSGDVRRLYAESHDFQTICEDFCQCADALQHWEQSNTKEAMTRRQEYEQLLQELSDEIRLYLSKVRE